MTYHFGKSILPSAECKKGDLSDRKRGRKDSDHKGFIQIFINEIAVTREGVINYSRILIGYTGLQFRI